MVIKYGIPLVAAGALGFAICTVSILTPKEQLGAAPHPPAVTTLAGQTISGLGEFQPAGEPVQIATPLSGIVQDVYVVAGAKVRKGDPLFKIDDRALNAELLIQQSNLAAAEAKLGKLRRGTRPEDIEPAKAKVEMATVHVKRSEDQLHRSEKLRQSAIVSEEDLTTRQFAVDQAMAELKLAKTELARLEAGTWAPDIMIAERDVSIAQSEVQRVMTDLERLVVRAPADGTILHVNVRVGELADANRSHAPLLLIAPAGPIQVRVQIDEADVGCFSTAARAEAYTRGRIRKNIPLRFVRVEPRVVPKTSLTGASVERVDTRVLFVIYEVEGSDEGMYAGQKLDVFIENLTEGSLAALP